MQATALPSPQDLLLQAEEMDRAGRTLLETAKKLRETASVLASLTPSVGGEAAKNGAGRKRPKTRLQELTDWLREHGPMSRGEIKKSSGIPAGTAGALLTRKNFIQTDGDLWTVKDVDAEPEK